MEMDPATVLEVAPTDERTAWELACHTKLVARFPATDVQWRVGRVVQRRAHMLAYIDARAVVRRLTRTFGVMGWQRDHRHVPGGAQCGIGVYDPFRYHWVWKWDAGSESDMEKLKGGHSDSFKRAAVSWGIGLYLHNLPPAWEDIHEGRTREHDTMGVMHKRQHIGWVRLPRLPAWALP